MESLAGTERPRHAMVTPTISNITDSPASNGQTVLPAPLAGAGDAFMRPIAPVVDQAPETPSSSVQKEYVSLITACVGRLQTMPTA